MEYSIENAAVAAVFDGYPEKMKQRLLTVRALILNTAAEIKEVGKLEETLKWGEPSYLTSQTKSGSTIRIHSRKAEPGTYGVFFNCQTTLVETFRQAYPDLFSFEGNRAILFHEDDDIPVDALRHCIAQALTYHFDKKANRQRANR